MARRPEVFVRPLSMEEGRRLQRITRTAKDPIKLRRAIVVMMSGQGQSVPDITSLMQVGDDYVRDVIHAFNERGFDALDPKWSGGRPPAISERVRERICLIAKTVPAEWGIAGMSTWSLRTLAEHLIARGVVAAISREHLRRILRKGGVSWQTTTTWKASTDPHFIAKMRRVLKLYDSPPADGRVICVDELGPLNLLPRKGKRWRPQGSPARLRATYHRYDGVMQMIAALDLATGKLFYRIRKRKRWREFLSFLKTLRARWPGEKLHVIMDNYSPHKHREVRAWAAANDVELVFLPTYGSWLNWIESEFAALRYYALNGTDHRSHAEQNAAIGAYVRWRNAQARPKTNFAASSPIRSWTSYPAKVA
ncbi:transposase [Streptosporangium lutulentum]|uniref:Transposase n=1 Tax=Streptosporangium lutulentum TaxID=1461250 RepID=A0ABT9Q9G2_9ACTN|nr:IS630 family transposase [Streptosporangium lutulentum]MDP9841165.1 transposase [Streptosporangium lutulentum]MDP9842362.1 transposase [Streptosporangium lutulentum]MDP9842769.1 transposase [Streptosporangium lutulentum]MDP9842973.1 transposase [Streptosporangium lutulentum]MDP9843534.1 transposase [Streptosporangium lutulentum]